VKARNKKQEKIPNPKKQITNKSQIPMTKITNKKRRRCPSRNDGRVLSFGI
jgi:hypothetical protein